MIHRVGLKKEDGSRAAEQLVPCLVRLELQRIGAHHFLPSQRSWDFPKFLRTRSTVHHFRVQNGLLRSCNPKNEMYKLSMCLIYIVHLKLHDVDFNLKCLTQKSPLG